MHAQERVILAVLGVWPDGRQQLIQYSIATAEDTPSWQAVWRRLCARGLDAAQVQVVVSDGAKGVLAAVQQELPQARLQRCTVHKVRGFRQYLRYSDLPTVDADGSPLSREAARQHRQQAMKTAALAIFDAPTRAEAEGCLQTFIVTWQSLEPAAVRNFTFGIKRCFTFYQLAAPLHRLVRSTNLLERFFREVRAKTDEIGAFPNDESCLVLFHLVMLREHAKHDRLDSAKT